MRSGFEVAPSGARRPGGTSTSPASPSALRVLVLSERPPAHTIQYVDQLLGDDSAGCAPREVAFEFRDRASELGDVDVVLLTQTHLVTGGGRIPERERDRRARRFAKAVKRRGIGLVRTLLSSEGDTDWGRSAAEEFLDRATAAYITLTPTMTTPGGRAPTVVPHSHLRYRFLGYPRVPQVSGRILMVSSSAFHPAYEAPIKVFSVANLPGTTLRLAGKVPSSLRESIARTLARCPATVSLREEAMSDAARVEEITQAELVVVAAPHTYEATSTLMLALSLDRPVLVEDTLATRELADEVGHDWVRLHPGRLTPTLLEDAVTYLRAKPPRGLPNLDGRDPNLVATRYAAAFHAAAAR